MNISTQTKQELRKIAKQARANLTLEDKHLFNTEIAKTLSNLRQFQEANTILFYASLADEVTTLEIIEKYLNSKQIIVPRVEGTKLVLHHLSKIEHLQKGNFQVLEPVLDAPVVGPSTIQLAIIPGLAFDENKNRLGYGKGFYDQLLPSLNCLKIGLAYECQMVKNVPVESHDKSLDMIITEKRIIN